MLSLDEHLAQGTPPVVAILRGVRPDEALGIGRVLVEAGVRLIEVPLNSPDPLESIERLCAELGGEALIGGGTVLRSDRVDAVAGVGGKLIVSPNTNPEVIARAVELGLDLLPGFATPTEAFLAIDAGARRLKLFPGSTLGPAHLRAVREVLPPGIRLWAVGGTGATNLASWLEAGAEGIGVGGSLYRAGDPADRVHTRALELVAAWRSIPPT